jgi:2-polyprenyl-3-methyl-5-hydroxy-6-metoxy-1,4-benzoquinol methylase
VVAGGAPHAGGGDLLPTAGRSGHSSAVGTYLHGYADAVLQVHRARTVENSAAHLAPHLCPGLDVLDVGCGPGTITVDLAARVAPGRVVGIDISPAPLEEARILAERKGVQVTFAVGDVHAIEVAAGSFDVVHAHQLLQYVPDPVSCLREMARVCRAAGVIATREGDYGSMAWYPADPWLDRWRQVYAGIVRANGGDPYAGRTLLAWAHAAGLREVTATTSSWCFATPGDREWWASSWVGRVSSPSFVEQATGHGLAGLDELDQLADAWRRWAAADDGWFGMLHGELLIRPGAPVDNARRVSHELRAVRVRGSGPVHPHRPPSRPWPPADQAGRCSGVPPWTAISNPSGKLRHPLRHRRYAPRPLAPTAPRHRPVP